MSTRIPHPVAVDALDVRLAERILDGGFRGQALFDYREARDLCWLVGALGCRGVHVTTADVRAALTGTPGRFFPGQPEYELIRGLRRAIDRIEDRAERGDLPDGATTAGLYRLFSENLFGLVEESLRDAEPWEVVPGIDYPRPDIVAPLLGRFDASSGYLDESGTFASMHPVVQAASLLRSFVHVSPFRDYNLITGALAASWYLLAHGYPPFLPQATDKATLRATIAGPAATFAEWFARTVLVGDRTVCASEGPRP